MYFVNQAKKMISSEFGILKGISKLSIHNNDPKLISYGVLPANTIPLGAAEFQGRSSGCATNLTDAFMTTLGEVAERYTPAFYQLEDMLHSTFKDLPQTHKSVAPSEYALYHPKQYDLYKRSNVPVYPFTEDTKLYWTEMTDLITGENSYVPSSLVYMPFLHDTHNITFTTSTGLAAHTNIYSAILTSLYECVERDCFTISWTHLLDLPKIKMTDEIKDFVHEIFDENVEIHFVDMTLDLEFPTVFGFCISQTEFGSIVTVGSSTRATYGEALKKVVKECAQAVSYLRYTKGNIGDWKKERMQLLDFEDHSVYYNYYEEERVVFDHWRNLKKEKIIDLEEKTDKTPLEIIHEMLEVFKKNNFNVLFKDTTTVDINQCGFYSVKILIPQIIQMSGAYPFYFWGGERIFTVPPKLGYPAKELKDFNRFPHPFP